MKRKEEKVRVRVRVNVTRCLIQRPNQNKAPDEVIKGQKKCAGARTRNQRF